MIEDLFNVDVPIDKSLKGEKLFVIIAHPNRSGRNSLHASEVVGSFKIKCPSHRERPEGL